MNQEGIIPEFESSTPTTTTIIKDEVIITEKEEPEIIATQEDLSQQQAVVPSSSSSLPLRIKGKNRCIEPGCTRVAVSGAQDNLRCLTHGVSNNNDA